MRIKSPFKDYYDGCLSLDQESEPLYIRRTKTEKIQNYHVLSPYCSIAGLHLEPFVIGLGTIVKRGLKATDTNDYVIGMNGSPKFKTVKFCYSTEDLREFIRKLGKKAIDEFDNPKRAKRFSRWRKKPSQEIDDFFAYKCKNISTWSMPIWAVWRNGWRDCILHSNIRLGSYGFARIVPPYEAFQELRTYLSNQAAPREYIPPISNEDMIEIKGFDPKTSFRAEKPGGPARKRRKNKRKNK